MVNFKAKKNTAYEVTVWRKTNRTCRWFENLCKQPWWIHVRLNTQPMLYTSE